MAKGIQLFQPMMMLLPSSLGALQLLFLDPKTLKTTPT